MASRERVEEKLRELIERLNGSGDGVRSSLRETRVLTVHVPDLPADYWTELSAGRMAPLREGAPGSADIRIRVGSERLVDLAEGRASLLAAYLAGEIGIEASIADMMRLRKLLS